MIPFTLASLADLQGADVDTIIDVRAPAEFAEDHLPGAINLPVLDDAQRAQVGTMYKQISAFDARKVGAALVAQNTALHLQGPLAGKGGGWQPLVYCWRGGQRSGAFATILDQIGWRVHLLSGGYQTYRRAVVASLYEADLPHRIVLIDGGTGTAKTELLHALAARGAQILDLEGLAGHRGSLFGKRGEAQPSQKMFESRIAAALGALDPAKMTFVEAESSKVGNRMIAPALWRLMTSCGRIYVEAPITARSAYLTRAYADITQDAETFIELLDKLRPYHPRDVIADWQTMARASAWEDLAEQLISQHYDPRYAKAMAGRAPALETMAMAGLEPEHIAQAAAALHARFS